MVCGGDRGFNSAPNRRYLQRAGGHYILGEKLRGGSKEAQAALARPGRYQRVAGNLLVKEVIVDEGAMRDRFVIYRNPELGGARLGHPGPAPRAGGGGHLRQRPPLTGQAPGVGQSLRARSILARFLRLTKKSRLCIDRACAAEKEHLDGKSLLRTSDPSLSRSTSP